MSHRRAAGNGVGWSRPAPDGAADAVAGAARPDGDGAAVPGYRMRPAARSASSMIFFTPVASDAVPRGGRWSVDDCRDGGIGDVASVPPDGRLVGPPANAT